MIIPPPLFEPRLQRRYQELVQAQLAQTTNIAAGVRAMPRTGQAFAATQAAYRFYQNQDVALPSLAFPLLNTAREAIATECQSCALVVHDWSNLHFGTHSSKHDRIALSTENDQGYKLYTALTLSDQGDPLGPVAMELSAQDGVHSTRSECPEPAGRPLDGLLPVMTMVGELKWDKPVVHVIDAEADSVDHFRQWHRAGHVFLVRADNEPRANFQGTEQPLSRVADHLKKSRAFRHSREVLYHGKPAQQYVAESEVVLTRAARPQAQEGQPRRNIPGEALPLRLVVTEVRTRSGRVLARWLLLSNASAEYSADTIALWYYWRWRIESYFKLLKTAGLNLEHWQQEKAAVLIRRLLVAAMACVTVWRLERDSSPAAQKLKTILVQLSGRQMKRSRPVTSSALLTGLWSLLAALALFERVPLEDLRALLAKVGLEMTNNRPPSQRDA